MKSFTLYNNLLITTAIILLVFSFFLVPQTFDIRIIYTYYVIDLRKLYWCLSALVMLLYLFYRFKPLPLLSLVLIRVHIMLTTVASLWIVAFHLFNGQNFAIIKTLNRYDVEEFRNNNLLLTILLFFLLFVQVVLLINLIKGQVARWKNRR
jgi:hypothetical protein